MPDASTVFGSGMVYLDCAGVFGRILCQEFFSLMLIDAALSMIINLQLHT
jgi:hypothetical protein